MATAEVGTVEKTGKPGHDRLQCVVVTPERTLFDELVDFVALPLYDGELGVLPGRIAADRPARLRRAADHATGGTTRRYFVDGGFAQVRDDVVTVLTNRAIPAADVDAAAAAHELEQAQTRRATTDLEQDEKDKAVARARAKIRVAGHRGGLTFLRVCVCGPALHSSVRTADPSESDRSPSPARTRSADAATAIGIPMCPRSRRPAPPRRRRWATNRPRPTPSARSIRREQVFGPG